MVPYAMCWWCTLVLVQVFNTVPGLLLCAVQGLHDEMAQVELDLLEADAKNRLYQLLGERTRQEHMALDQKVCCCCFMLAMSVQSCPPRVWEAHS